MLSEHLRGGLSFASQRYAESSSFKERKNKMDPTNAQQEILVDSLKEILIDIDANK